MEKYQHLKNRTVKLVGCPKGGSDTTYRLMLQLQKAPWPSAIDTGKGSSVTVDNNDNWACWIRIYKDATVSNLTFKPMLTTNLSATYDDFVPYTGDGETLTHDVADLNGSLKSKILMELTVSEYGAVCLGLETDCIIDAVMLPVNNYIIIPFNVPPLWYGIICQNTPKYPIVTGVTIPEGTKVYYHSIN